MTMPVEQTDELLFSQDLMNKILIETAGSPGADYRVLSYYVTAVPLGQTVRKTAREVAGAIQVTEGTASKSIKRLLSGGWLEVVYAVAGVNFYRVGPRVLDLLDEQEDQPLATVSHLPVRSAEYGDE